MLLSINNTKINDIKIFDKDDGTKIALIFNVRNEVSYTLNFTLKVQKKQK